MATTQFRLNVRRWRNNTAANLEALGRQSIQELAFRIVNNTPVDTGFLRGSWQPSINVMAEGPLGANGNVLKSAAKIKDPSGAAAFQKIAASVIGIKPGDTFYMSNNAVYAMRMEYGFYGEDSLGRTYHQAGRYFVTGTVAEWMGIVTSVAAELGLTKGGAIPAPPSTPGPK